MAIFNQPNKNTIHKGKSILSNGCSIRGEIELNADCHIDGYFEGSIFSTNNITIGQSGNVTGFILAKNIIISGKFNGQIDCQFLEIKSGGEVHGEVKTENINFETGALFTGYSHKADSQDFYRILPKQVKVHLEKSQIIDAEIDENKSKEAQKTLKLSQSND